MQCNGSVRVTMVVEPEMAADMDQMEHAIQEVGHQASK